MLWKLRGQQVTAITAKLVGFRDGKPAAEIDLQVECEFSEAARQGGFEANLVYSVVRGDLFGHLGRRMAWLEIKFTKGAPSSTVSRNRPCTFELAELPAAAEMRSHGGDVSRGESKMLAFSSHLPPANERRFEVHDLASLAALSRKGGLTWGVFLEWNADRE